MVQRSVSQTLDVYVRDLKTPPGLTVPDGHQCLCPAQSLVPFLAGLGPGLSGSHLLDGPIRPAWQLISSLSPATPDGNPRPSSNPSLKLNKTVGDCWWALLLATSSAFYAVKESLADLAGPAVPHSLTPRTLLAHSVPQQHIENIIF